MPRALRQLQDKGFYHIISRGNNHDSVLGADGGYEKFMNILITAKAKFDWRIHHYCLMPTHVHLLGCIENGRDLPRIMQHVLQGYSTWFRKKTEYVGHLWQGRYRSPLIENDSYLLQCGRYIERNPVQAGLVSKPEDYAWSSYRYYALGEPNPIIDEAPLYQDFGVNKDARQRAYCKFISLETPYELIVPEAASKEAGTEEAASSVKRETVPR